MRGREWDWIEGKKRIVILWREEEYKKINYK
jgi:hypothetical protein